MRDLEESGMTVFLTLSEAVSKYVTPGCSLAAEGFTHLIPHAAGAEIIRQRIRDLTLIRMTPDIIYDQLIGMGCAHKLVFSWGGNPGVGSLFRLRDAYENGVPHDMEFEEHSHAAMANAYAAGAAGMPCAIFKGYRGTEYPEVNPSIRFIECPFSGEQLTAIPAHRPDVAIVHAQRADHQGNVWMTGILGVQKEAVLAAGCSIVTVEEVVGNVDERAGGTVIPHWAVDVVCESRLGAFPSYAEGYYDRSNAFYQRWGEVSRDYDRFRDWMLRYVLECDDFAHTLARLKDDGYV
jgi:glutaconate CoA-transferase subunit A